MKRLAVAIALIAVALCTSAFGYYTWKWDKENGADSVYDPTNTYNLWLTDNNGSHAVALVGDRTIVTGYFCTYPDNPVKVTAYEWSVGQQQSPFPNYLWESDNQFPLPGFPCVAANEDWKLFMCSDGDEDGQYKDACLGKTGHLGEMNVQNYQGINFTKTRYENKHHTLAPLCIHTGDTMVAAYDAYDGNDQDWYLASRITTSAGDDEWGGADGTIPIQQGAMVEPSLGVSAGESVYVAYRNALTDNVIFEKSTDYGGRWDYMASTLGAGTTPCIAAGGQFIFACWHSSGKIAYKFSRDGGANWIGPDTVSRFGNGCSHTSVSLVTYGTSDTAVLLASQWSSDATRFVFYRYGVLVKGQTPHIAWQAVGAMPGTGTDNYQRPSLATAGSSGRLVYNTPIGHPEGEDPHLRGIHLRRGSVFDDNGSYPRDAVPVGTGRLIARRNDGSIQHAAMVRPHVVSGPVEPELIPILVAPGNQPALALDGAGKRWVSYVNADTVWTMTGDGSYKVAFAGSTSAVPGQPSIVCYPN